MTYELWDFVQSRLPKLREQVSGDPALAGLSALDGDIVYAWMRHLARNRIVVARRTPAPSWGKLGVLDCWFASPEIADTLRVPLSKGHRYALREGDRRRARAAARAAERSAERAASEAVSSV